MSPFVVVVDDDVLLLFLLFDNDDDVLVNFNEVELAMTSAELNAWAEDVFCPGKKTVHCRFVVGAVAASFVFVVVVVVVVLFAAFSC